MPIDPKTLPPPRREDPRRRLNLKLSMVRQSVRQTQDSIKHSLENIQSKVQQSGDRTIAIQPTEPGLKRLEDHLVILEARLFSERELLSEMTRSLHEREIALDQKAALIEARDQIVLSRQASMPNKAGDQVTREEREALETFRAELEKRERSLQEREDFLETRSAYVEECENDLLERTLRLTEREAEIAQAEDDLAHAYQSAGKPFAQSSQR